MAKKIKKYKVGCDSETYKISMVTEPAIEVDYIALEKQEEVEIKLSSDERHICYGPVLVPNRDIYRNNGEQEFYINFTEESIVKMSQDFLKNSKQHEINLQHDDDVDEVFVCESWTIEDPYKDKANALGFTLPKGTWMVGVKVNNVEVWDRVKSGELKGFSVESAISLEDFEKQNDNNMNLETNDEMFWSKLKNTIAELFSKETEKSEPIAEPIELEEQVPTEPAVEPQEPTVTEPIAEPQEPKQEPQPSTEPQEPQNEPTEPQNEPQPQVADTKHLEDLIASLKDEINALKEMNNGLNDRVKELSKEPSTKPVNTNAKPNAGDTYASWREQMRSYIG